MSDGGKVEAVSRSTSTATTAESPPGISQSSKPLPGLSNAAVARAAASTPTAASLGRPPAGLSNAAVRAAASTPTATAPGRPLPGLSNAVDTPVAGVNKVGFIDHSDGSNIRTGPAETGGQKVREEPLPPATQVFVSGKHPHTSSWWYVTAYVDKGFLRGYVQDFRVTTDLPEPTAKLYQIMSGDTVERLAVQEFSTAIRDGHDLRFYENVLLFVNREKGRVGITGSYQDPGLLGGGADNIQLRAGHRIWLVSPAYAQALEKVVPSGSLTGGAVAKLKRFAGHLEDIFASVVESPDHLGEVAGEYAQAIVDHIVQIVGIITAFIMAEALSAFLAATPTGVGQIAAVVIQLGLAAFGAAGIISAGLEAVKHASDWLTLAWTASGDKAKIAAASREFLKMLVSIAMAALAYLGVKGNLAKAATIFRSLPPPPPMLAFAVEGGGRLESGWAAKPVAIGPPGPPGPMGTAAMMTNVTEETGGAAEGSKAEEPETAKQSSEGTKKPAPSAAQRPPRQSAVGKGAKGFQAWTRTNTAAGRLPRFSGRGQQFVEDALRNAGFREVMPNEWVHPDGSYVRIDPPQTPGVGWTPEDPYYHPKSAPEAPFRSLNEPHYHKEWRYPKTNDLYHLDDAGYINQDPGQTHIIGR